MFTAVKTSHLTLQAAYCSLQFYILELTQSLGFE
jgi:hypothetical protein